MVRSNKRCSKLKIAKLGVFLIYKLIDVIKKVIKSPTAMVLALFACANLLSTILNGIGGILQATWVNPEVLGCFYKYAILTGYVNVLLIFVQDGLSRQYPYLIGAGEIEKAEAFASVGKFWYLCVAFIAMSGFGFMTIRALLFQDWFGVAGWFTQVISVLQHTYGTYLQTMYRRSMEFKRLSYNSLIMSVICFVLLIAVKFFGFFGLAVRQITQGAIRVWLDAKYLPVKVKAKWDSKIFIHLAKISIPLSLIGYIRTSFITSTFSLIVLRYCGEGSLGLYGIAVAIEGAAQTFINSLWQFFNVKMTIRYGVDDSIGKTVKTLIKPTIFAVILAVLCALALCVCAGPFVRFFVPKYVGAIPVIYILSIGMVLTALRLPTEVLRTALRYNVVFLIAIVKVLVVVFSMLLGEKTIVWFAWCSILGLVSDVILGYLLLIILIRKENR